MLRPRRLRGSSTRSPASVARADLCSSTADTHRSAATAPLAETMLQRREAAGCSECVGCCYLMQDMNMPSCRFLSLGGRLISTPGTEYGAIYNITI